MRTSFIFGIVLAISAANLTTTTTAFAAGDPEDIDLVCYEADDGSVICDNMLDIILECGLADPKGTTAPCNGDGWLSKRKPQIAAQPPQAPQTKPQRKRPLKTALPGRARAKMKRHASRKHHRTTKRRTRR